MDKETFAEYLLTLTYGRNRASEIIGDLMEQNISPKRFWLNVTGISMARIWRCLVAFLCFTTTVLIGAPRYFETFHSHMANDGLTVSPAVFWLISACCVWSALVLNFATRGIRDKGTGVGILFISTFLMNACSFWSNFYPYALGMTAVLFSACLLVKAFRKASIGLLTSALSFAVVFWLLIHACGLSSSSSLLLSTLDISGVWAISFVAEAILLEQAQRWIGLDFQTS